MSGARRIGVDLGGVVIDGRNDTMFTERFLETPEVDGAFAALSRLVEAGWEVFVVSKCGQRMEDASRLWLLDRGFYGRTGVLPERVRFCRRRPEKGVIAEELGLDAFVDDRLDVLRAVLPQVTTAVLFDPRRDPSTVDAVLASQVTTVRTWDQALRALCV